MIFLERWRLILLLSGPVLLVVEFLGEISYHCLDHLPPSTSPKTLFSKKLSIILRFVHFTDLFRSRPKFWESQNFQQAAIAQTLIIFIGNIQANNFSICHSEHLNRKVVKLFLFIWKMYYGLYKKKTKTGPWIIVL